MSLGRRLFVTLACDAGCGTRLDTEVSNHIAARVEGGLKGWRYVQGVWLLDPEQRNDFHKRRDSQQTLRSIDVCPGCEVPPEGSQIHAGEVTP